MDDYFREPDYFKRVLREARERRIQEYEKELPKEDQRNNDKEEGTS